MIDNTEPGVEVKVSLPLYVNLIYSPNTSKKCRKPVSLDFTPLDARLLLLRFFLCLGNMSYIYNNILRNHLNGLYG